MHDRLSAGVVHEKRRSCAQPAMIRSRFREKSRNRVVFTFIIPIVGDVWQFVWKAHRRNVYSGGTHVCTRTRIRSLSESYRTELND